MKLQKTVKKRAKEELNRKRLAAARMQNEIEPRRTDAAATRGWEAGTTNEMKQSEKDDVEMTQSRDTAIQSPEAMRKGSKNALT